MVTKSVNGKSVILAARVPLEVAQTARSLLVEGENLSEFIVAALRREADSRTGARVVPASPVSRKTRMLI